MIKQSDSHLWLGNNVQKKVVLKHKQCPVCIRFPCELNIQGIKTYKQLCCFSPLISSLVKNSMVLGVIHLGCSWLISVSTQSRASPGGALWIRFKKIWSLTAHLLYILKHTYTCIYTGTAACLDQPTCCWPDVTCCCVLTPSHFQISLLWDRFLRINKNSMCSNAKLVFLCRTIGQVFANKMLLSKI